MMRYSQRAQLVARAHARGVAILEDVTTTKNLMDWKRFLIKKGMDDEYGLLYLDKFWYLVRFPEYHEIKEKIDAYE